MKHMTRISAARPALAGGDEFYCQLAAILSLIGIRPNKDILEKCIGID